MLTWFRKKTKAIMITVAVVFAASMFYGIGYSGLKNMEGGEKASDVLAKVNGQKVDPLRYSELLRRISVQFGANVGPQEMAFVENIALGQAIDFTLMQNEAKKRVKVSGGEIDAAINGIMQQQKIPSKQILEENLRRMGLDYGKLKDLVKGDLLVQKFVMKLREDVKVTPDDLREIRASHILVSNEAEAKAILDKIKKGEDFAVLAKKHSKDPGSAAKGGDLGYFASGAMVPQFEKAAFGLKAGEVSGAVESPYGCHIIKVTDIRLKQVKGGEKNIENAILMEKQQKAYQNWYSGARASAKIEIVNPELKGNDYRFRGKIPQAIEEYKKAVAQFPSSPYLHVFLGDCYYSTGEKALAITEYENAIRIEGGDPRLYIVLGKAYDGMGESAKAAEQFKKASLIAGDNKLMHEFLLKTFQDMKKTRETAIERAELKRLEKRDLFEKSLQKKM